MLIFSQERLDEQAKIRHRKYVSLSHRFFSFLILAAFLAGLVAPACHFRWHQGNGGYIEICTLDGLKRIAQADLWHQDISGSDKAQLCAFCVADGAAKTVPLPLDWQSPYFEKNETPFPLYLADAILFLWRAHGSRAPPLFF
jgi:hypothetical protein